MESLPSTSDIKMIDIWLIFCQIYPFVEVVLLTAREYQRDEKRVGDKMMSMNVHEIDEEIESEGIRCRSCQHPTFEITGRDFRKAYFLLLLLYCCIFNFLYKKIVVWIRVDPSLIPYIHPGSSCFHTERIILPSVVLVSFIAYFGIAAMFYFDYWFHRSTVFLWYLYFIKRVL